MESSVSVLIGRYVHKLNGLVGLIRAEIKILQIGKANLLTQDDTLATALDNIEDLASQVLSLTDEFKLSFTSPQTGDLVSVKAIVSQVLQVNELPDNIQTNFESDNEIPDVYADRNLSEVFSNLITNAVEAMPDGGNIRISVKNNKTTNNVDVIFTDSGRGIPLYVVDSLLFKPYYSTKEQKGHGLGLWWAKLYLESIGGKISLLSTKIGEGTSFLVSLPISAQSMG